MSALWRTDAHVNLKARPPCFNLISVIKSNKEPDNGRKEVGQDEEGSEQEGSCQGGRFLDRLYEGDKGKSWQGMPQVKGLKELELLVEQQDNLTGRGRKVTDRALPACRIINGSPRINERRHNMNRRLVIK